jgi:hypothetical protein
MGDNCGFTKNTLKDNNAGGFAYALKAFPTSAGVPYYVDFTILKDSDTTRRLRLDGEGNLYMWFRTDTGVIADVNGWTNTSVTDLGTHWRVRGQMTAPDTSYTVVIYPSIGPTGSQYDNTLLGSATFSDVTVTAV